MTADQKAALAPYFAPTRHGIFPGMPMEEYRAIPAFNPSLVKLGASEIKNSGARGHIIRLLDKIENDHRVSMGQKPLPGRGDNGSASKDLGTLYHQLLLEPDSFDEKFVILTPEISAGLLECARARKVADAPALSSRTKEWREFKSANGRDPDDAEQAALQAQRSQTIAEGVEWHSRLTEYVEWVDEQASKGVRVVTESEVSLARTMAEAIYELPANREIADFLRTQGPISAERVEVTMFAKLEWANGGSVGLKGRPDIIARSDCFLDPKSCQSVHPHDFARSVDNFGYAIQAGAYTLMSELLEDIPEASTMGFPKKEFGFIAQESAAPFLAKLWWLPPQWIAYGRQRFLSIIRSVQQASETGDWSGGADDFVFPSRPDNDFPGEQLEPPAYLMPTLEHF